MTTAAPRPDEALTLDEIDERTLDAWSRYREDLRELSGREYADAEDRSWERLQDELRLRERRRSQLEASEPPARSSA